MAAIKNIFFSFLALLSAICPAAQADEPLKLDAATACSTAKSYKCYGACVDGWGFDCYYDSRKGGPEDGTAVASQKSRCLATYNVSSCTPCRNEFEYQGKPVTCEDFYSKLSEFNKSCGGCLKKRSDYGG